MITTTTSVTTSVDSKKGYGCLTLFGLPFAAVGVFMIFLIGKQFIGYQQASSWEEVPATLAEVTLNRHSSSDGSTRSVSAIYHYSFKGNDYTGEKVSLSTGSDNIGSFHTDLFETLNAAKEAGRTVPCYVDPEDPSRSLLNRDLRLPMLYFFTAFAMVFGGAGFSIVGFAVYKLLSSPRSATHFNDEPWKTRADWAAGYVRSGSRTMVIVSSMIAIIISGFALPMLAILPQELLVKKNYAALLALIFPLLAAGFIAWAIRSILVWRKFGSSLLRLDTIPVEPGSSLRGNILLPRDISVEAPMIELALVCSQMVKRRSGNKTTYSTNQLFRETFRANTLQPSAEGSRILVDIPMPERVTSSQEGSITWKLEVRAELSGADLVLDFELPVFYRSSKFGSRS